MRNSLIAASILSMGLIGLSAVGCGENQPNAPAQPAEVSSADFAKKTADMMKNANTGMDPKQSKTAAKK